MSTGPRIPYATALVAASLFIANIAHVCERIEIAGSLRRHTCNPHRPDSTTVGDIEIVAIPKTEGKTNLLWQRMELLKHRLWEGKNAAGKTYHKAGPLHRKYWIPAPGPVLYQPKGAAPDAPWHVKPTPRFACELYLASQDNYGYIMALRTGPEDFNKLLVRAVSQNGLKPADIDMEGGKVWLRTPAVESGRVQWHIPHEIDLFRALGLHLIPPHRRSGDLAAMLAYRQAIMEDAA